MTIGTTTLGVGTGGDKILNDSLTTVNGASAPGGAVAQVAKLAFGPPGDAQLVEGGNGMPVVGPLTDAQLRATGLPLPVGAATETGNLAALLARTPPLGQAAAAGSSSVVLASDQGPVPTSVAVGVASGAITTQNLVPNGVATAGSAVELVLGGAASAAVQVTGTYTGALSVQVTIDGTRWETVTGACVTNMLSGVSAATIVSATIGVFTAPCHGALRVRVTGLAAVTGTATVSLRALMGPSVVYMLQPTAANLNATVAGTVTANIGTGALAAGTNAIGDVGVQYRATATGGASAGSVLSPATPAAATVKASAGRLVGWQLVNTSAALRSVKLFNAAAPTLGTTAAVFEIDLPAGGRSDVQLPGGIGAFGTACTYSVTSAKGLTDNTATGLAANDVSGAFFFA